MKGTTAGLIRGAGSVGTLVRVPTTLLGGRLPRPDVPSSDVARLPVADRDAGVRVTFMGASTLLVEARDDAGSSTVLVDPFFSRPGVLRCVLTAIAPDHERVDACLHRLGVEQLDAVVVTHSHYDHVMDAPYVARRTGARLVGSSSTAMVGRGAEMAEDDLVELKGGGTVQIGRLGVTLVPSAHVAPVHFPGDIEAPLEAPTPVRSYRVGECFSLHLQVGERAVLVQGSAGSVPGALAGLSADTVYLAVGSLGHLPASTRDSYWDDVVRTVGADRVLVTHWDDLWQASTKRLVPLPYLVDNLPATMRSLRARADAEDVELRWPTPWQPTDPFAGLDP